MQKNISGTRLPAGSPKPEKKTVPAFENLTGIREVFFFARKKRQKTGGETFAIQRTICGKKSKKLAKWDKKIRKILNYFDRVL